MKNYIYIFISLCLFACSQEEELPNNEPQQEITRSFFEIDFFDQIRKQKITTLSYPLVISVDDHVLEVNCPPVMLDPSQPCDNTGGGAGSGNSCGHGFVHLKARSGLRMGTYNMKFHYQEDENGNSKVDVSGFSTTMNGITFNSEWTQDGTPLITYPEDGVVEIEVAGHVDHSVTVQTITGAASREVKLKTRYNMCTGSGSGTIEEILESYEL